MRTLFIILLVALGLESYGQQTITDSITHGGIQRTYILYVPATYVPGNPTPLVINFHGYTSNANDQMIYGNFRPIADTAGFLLVHPMGTLDLQGNTYWNANWGGTVDDIGFTEALIDSLALNYNINLNRVYSTGMSNGGFMSYTLACELGNRIAAIASVTGSMNFNQTSTCVPQHPTPVMEIHGTADATVPYLGSAGSMESIPNVIDYWVNYNQCDTNAIVNNVPDINTIDGCTAVHYRYENGTNDVTVEHYQIVNGGHTWPGAPFAIGTTNYDINASLKIWEFFAKYDINGLLTSSQEVQFQENNLGVNVYPNPSSRRVYFDFPNNHQKAKEIIVLDALGKPVRTLSSRDNAQLFLERKGLKSGWYMYQVFYEDATIEHGKFILN
jgi:polyhydroxybutyrate depolymerase